ncbi:MAG: riboflavin biosynthesis protein RibF, partial [Eggerthellaceae bacterium]|nr:riboflavin biosynthesis protein RibF [Eggerthellaceae bacterium]
MSGARHANAQSIIITFDIDPDEIFRPKTHKKLMTNETRIEALRDSGADDVVVLPFTRKFAALEPEVFLDLMFGRFTPDQLHVGRDFRFGYKSSGDADDLKAWGKDHGMKVYAHDLLSEDGQVVTSTRIRALLARGEVC